MSGQSTDVLNHPNNEAHQPAGWCVLLFGWLAGSHSGGGHPLEEAVDRSVYIVKYPCPDGVIFVSPDVKQKLIKIVDNDVILILNNTEVVEANWAADGYAYTVSFENMGLTAHSVAPILSQIR